MREIVSPLSGIRSPFGARRNPLAAYAAAGFTPKLVADFADEFYGKEGRKSTFGGVLEPTATTNGTMVDSDGLLKWRPHNLLTDTVGLTTNWGLSAQGTGSLPTITREYAAAPDGTMTAARLQCSRTSSGNGDRSYFFQNISTVIGSTLTEALWVKSTDGTSQTIQLWNQQEANARLTETVGSSWQRISLEYPVLNATTGKLWIGLVGAGTTDLTTDVLIWHPHLYRSDLGGMASDPDQPAGFETEVPTTGSTAVYLPRRGHHIYNGSAWVNEGVLIDPETRTNLITYPIPDSNWSPVQATISENVSGITAPDGTETASKGVESTAGSTHRVDFAVPIANGVPHAYSIFAKEAGRDTIVMEIGRGSISSNYARFDLSNGTVAAEVGSAKGFIEAFGNGWYRCSVVAAAGSFDKVLLGIWDGTNQSYAGDGSSGVYLWGAQLEEGSTPSSYIPTYGSQVARAGEQLVIPHENISWPAGDELSIHMQGRMTYADTGSNNALTLINYESGGEQIAYRLRTDGTRQGAVQILQRASAVLDTVETASGSVYTPGVNVPFNIASRHGSTFVNGAVDGVALTENTTPTSFPDLQTTNLQLAYSGGPMVLKEVSLWDVNITDTGTEDATDD